MPGLRGKATGGNEAQASREEGRSSDGSNPGGNPGGNREEVGNARFVQIKCTRCLCVNTFDEGSAQVEAIERNGFGLKERRQFGCKKEPCYCHNGIGQRKAKLIARILDYGDCPF